jgi:hypothetical protein
MGSSFALYVVAHQIPEISGSAPAATAADAATTSAAAVAAAVTYLIHLLPRIGAPETTGFHGFQNNQ